VFSRGTLDRRGSESRVTKLVRSCLSGDLFIVLAVWWFYFPCSALTLLCQLSGTSGFCALPLCPTIFSRAVAFPLWFFSLLVLVVVAPVECAGVSSYTTTMLIVKTCQALPCCTYIQNIVSRQQNHVHINKTGITLQNLTLIPEDGATERWII
jgi:hypothetical protein